MTLTPKQNTSCFLEAHEHFFKEIGGVFITVVYDNTRVAVKRFIGKSNKEPINVLLNISSNMDFVMLIVVMKKVM